MQFPFNWMAQGIVEGSLRDVCTVHVQEQVLPEVMAIDAWVEPLTMWTREREERGVIGRMASAPCTIEPFRKGPTEADANDCMMKVYALHRRQRKRAKDDKQDEPPTPVLWFVSAQRPSTFMERHAMRPMPGWPSGFYASASPAGPRLAVVRELPPGRETLLLRLMGVDEVFRAAVREFEALPRDAWERAVVEPLLVQLERDLPRMGVTVTFAEESDMVSYEEAVRVWKEERRKMDDAQRRAEEAVRGAEEAVRGVVHLFERRLGRLMTAEERAAWQQRYDALGAERLCDVAIDLDAAALAAWLAEPATR